MQDLVLPQTNSWPLWRKIIFRFFFIYFLLFAAPWSWLSVIPGAGFLLKYYYQFFEWAVIKANTNYFQVFHIKYVHLVRNGSGDTSFNWAEICFTLSVSLIGCIVWSIVDRKRESYRGLNYLLCLMLRYYLVLVAFDYGVDKILAQQMPFPLVSQLATPLGDLLPMRFSWLFIGYSTPYQIFSGCMEVLFGLLLLYRRTATMGVIVATGVFMNVMMFNLCYDIVVKLYSMNLVLICFYLLANESKRIACFFVLNKPAPEGNLYHYPLRKKWMRITRIVLKLMIFFMVGKSVYDTFYDTEGLYKQYRNIQEIKPLKSGVYDVTKYAVNKDTFPPLLTDTSRWQDMIIEKGGYGSIKTNDTLFRKRYGRQYFGFTSDTIKQTIGFKKFPQDSVPVLTMTYQVPDSNTIQLWGKKNNDSLYVELKKSNRHFQLAERQFHWLSEANR